MRKITICFFIFVFFLMSTNISWAVYFDVWDGHPMIGGPLR